MGPALGVSIPLFDEEAVAEGFVRSVHDALTQAKIPHKLVLVNNGSTDGTPALLNRLSVEIDACEAVHLSENAGYGGGILMGMRALDTPIVGWMWGDGQVNAATLVACYEKLISEELDLCKAHRVQRNDGLQRRVVSSSYNRLVQWMGSGVCDANGCPKLMKKEVFEALELSSYDWFLDAEAVLKASESGLSWGSVETTMHAREGGFSKVHRDTIIEFAGNLWLWNKGWRP